MIIANFEEEKKLSKEGFDWVIGVDEAGRGPLAGPVVACATTVRNFQFPITNFQTNSNDQISNSGLWDLVRDSKTLSEKQREKMFDFVREHFLVGVGMCDHAAIDRINILEATYLAMKKAVQELQRKIAKENLESYKLKAKSCILVDGNKIIPNFSMEQKAVVNGDKYVKSIAAASIVAKVTRDRIMLEMDGKYPQYRFAKHKGYGTKIHMKALSEHGPCPIHRRSFAPVSRVSTLANLKKG